MKVWLIACALVIVIIGDTLALRFWNFGDLNFAHTLLTVFLAVNVLACYFEICLLLRIDSIEAKRQRWDSLRWSSGTVPTIEFLTTCVPLRRICSPAVWSELWGFIRFTMCPIPTENLWLSRRHRKRCRDAYSLVATSWNHHDPLCPGTSSKHSRNPALLAVDLRDVDLHREFFPGRPLSIDSTERNTAVHLGP